MHFSTLCFPPAPGGDSFLLAYAILLVHLFGIAAIVIFILVFFFYMRRHGRFRVFQLRVCMIMRVFVGYNALSNKYLTRYETVNLLQAFSSYWTPAYTNTLRKTSMKIHAMKLVQFYLVCMIKYCLVLTRNFCGPSPSLYISNVG